jgi:membrane protein
MPIIKAVENTKTIAIIGAVFGKDAAQGEIVQQIDQLVGEQGAQAIETALINLNFPPFKLFL